MSLGFDPVANTSECQVRYQHGTNLLQNGFAYKWAGGTPSAAELLSLAAEIAGTIANKMAILMHVNVAWREVYCRNIDTDVANQGTYVFPAPPGTGRSGGQLAGNEAAGLVKRTGLTGRTHHGRNSFSEFAEGDVDGNTLSSFILTQLASIALSVLAARVSGRFQPAIASRLLGTSAVLTSALSLDSNVDSQKTRLNSHGT